MIPILFTLSIIYGVMGYLGVPLDDTTVFIACIAIGIGIDYTIHFLVRLREELKAGADEREALSRTIATSGRAIMINALTVMMGFIVIVFGSFVPMQRFGSLLALTMIITSVGAITILPAAVFATGAGFLYRNINRKGGLEG